MNKGKTEIIYKSCERIFLYIPSRIICFDCYEKQNFIKPSEEDNFIESNIDDE